MNYDQRIFQEEQGGGEQQSDSQYNMKLLRTMRKNSPLSFWMLITIFTMFIICIVTDIKQSRFSFQRISPQTLLSFGANSFQKVYLNKQYYRLFTAMFLHAGFAHLFMNSLSFLLFLIPVEARVRNHKIYLLTLLLGGMLGNFLFIDVAILRHTGGAAVGASTSICSVIGFDMAYRILRVDHMPLQSRRILTTLAYIFIISMIPGVDFWGHFGSLFGGFLIGASFLPPSCLYWSKYAIDRIKLAARVVLILYTAILLIPLI